MSALGDRIIRDGPVTERWLHFRQVAPAAPIAEWNALRDELIELRAAAAAVPRLRAALAAALEVTPPDQSRWSAGEWRGIRPGGQLSVTRSNEPGNPLTCTVCGAPVKPGMVECAGCAGAEDAAAKRADDR